MKKFFHVFFDHVVEMQPTDLLRTWKNAEHDAFMAARFGFTDAISHAPHFSLDTFADDFGYSVTLKKLCLALGTRSADGTSKRMNGMKIYGCGHGEQFELTLVAKNFDF